MQVLAPSDDRPLSAAPTGRVENDSSTALPVPAGVGLVTSDPVLERELREMLASDFLILPADAVGTAAAVVVDARHDAARIGVARGNARADVAIVAIVTGTDAATAACGAGAFACVHPPLVADELAGVLSSALDSGRLKAYATHREYPLDVEAHLALIGRIGAGLGHEVANPLAAAMVNLDVVRDELASLGIAQRGVVFEALGDLGTSLERIRALLEHLRPLVRHEKVALEAVDLASCTADVVRRLNETFVAVEIEVVGGRFRGLAVPMMLTQILVHLATNGAHAARALSSPRVRFNAYRQDDRVVVSVRDNGRGIAEDDLERIFEPFYTTRRESGGLGLGLALCREYARRMEATLTVSSAPGRGACFRLSLRAA